MGTRPPSLEVVLFPSPIPTSGLSPGSLSLSLCVVLFSSNPWLQSRACRKRCRYWDTTVASPPHNGSMAWDRMHAQLCKRHGNGVSSTITSHVVKAGPAFQLWSCRRCEAPLLPASAPGKAHRLCSFGCSSPAGLEQTRSQRECRQC